MNNIRLFLAGLCAFVATAVVNAQVPLYRYAGNGDHFYTTNWSELGGGGGGLNYEGIQCKVLTSQAPGSVPLYRYAGNGKHFYTTNWGELGNGGAGYNYEGVAAYVYPTQRVGTVPLHRYFDQRYGTHLYTTNPSEVSAHWELVYNPAYMEEFDPYNTGVDYFGNEKFTYMLIYDFTDEGIQCYVYPQ